MLESTRVAALGAISLFLIHGSVSAAESPIPSLVSPGSPDGFAAVQGPCPTFSWAGLLRGTSQELVVYEVRESGVESDATLTLRLPALASSWTPGSNECLERGKSYAWSLRAIDDSATSAWAETRFFTIPAAPSDEELRAALEVVRAHAALRDDDAQGGDGLQRGASQQIGAPGLAATRPVEDAPAQDGRTRATRAGAVAAFRIASNGGVEATSFSGDGSGLFNIGAAAIAAGAVGSSEIAFNAVGQSEIATNGVGQAEIEPNSITASEMAGSFCLVKRGSNACPSGYEEYFLKFDTEDTSNDDICDEEVASVCPNLYSEIYLSFCCA